MTREGHIYQLKQHLKGNNYYMSLASKQYWQEHWEEVIEALEQEPTTKNDCAEQNGCISCSLDDGDDCCRKLYEESMQEPTTKIDCDKTDCNNCVNHKCCDYEPTTKNDLGVREFEEIVVEYSPEDLCTYPEYKGKPYFSIKYKEGNDCFIGYGTYNPKVFSRYLRDYFMPSVTSQESRWIPVGERLPETDDKVLCWYEYYHWSQEKVLPEYGIGCYFKETSAWYGEVAIGRDVRVIAWMPLQPYKAESEEK